MASLGLWPLDDFGVQTCQTLRDRLQTNVITASDLANLWIQHSSRLLIIARAWGEPAEDAVQESFVALARQSTLPADPLAWLVKTMRNFLLQWHRSGQRRLAREQSAARDRSATDARSWFTVHHDFDQRLDAIEVTQWLVELPREDREVIVMHLWGNLTFRQIAEVTGESSANAHRRYARGLESLRQKAMPPVNEPNKGAIL